MPARARPPAGKESCAEGVNQSASVFWGLQAISQEHREWEMFRRNCDSFVILFGLTSE